MDGFLRNRRAESPSSLLAFIKSDSTPHPSGGQGNALPVTWHRQCMSTIDSGQHYKPCHITRGQRRINLKQTSISQLCYFFLEILPWRIGKGWICLCHHFRNTHFNSACCLLQVKTSHWLTWFPRTYTASFFCFSHCFLIVCSVPFNMQCFY